MGNFRFFAIKEQKNNEIKSVVTDFSILLRM